MGRGVPRERVRVQPAPAATPQLYVEGAFPRLGLAANDAGVGRRWPVTLN